MKKKIKKMCAKNDKCINKKCPFQHSIQQKKLCEIKNSIDSQNIKYKYEIDEIYENEPEIIFDPSISEKNEFFSRKIVVNSIQPKQRKEVSSCKDRKCLRCNQLFTLSVEEKKWFINKLLNIPKRCKECRLLRKLETSEIF